MCLLLSICDVWCNRNENRKSWIRLNYVNTSPRNFCKNTIMHQKFIVVFRYCDSASSRRTRVRISFGKFYVTAPVTLCSLFKSHTLNQSSPIERNCFLFRLLRVSIFYAMKYSKSACVTSFIRNCLRTVCKYTWSWCWMLLYSCARCTL